MNGLSVCMIARDEASRIGASLASIRGIADEIIVVDTGSTDDTVAIAKSHGAAVVHYTWSDDFAAARNAALPHIRGRWMFWIDADERLIPESADRLADFLAMRDAWGFGVFRNDYVEGLKPGMPRGEYMASQLPRIFRTDLGIHYTGRCHEQPMPSAREFFEQRGLKIYVSPVTLEHDCGYFGAERHGKAARNTRLLEMEVADRPGRTYWMIQCAAGLLESPGRVWEGHRMMGDAIKLLIDARNNPEPPGGMAAIALEYAAFPLQAASAHVPLPLDRDGAIELANHWFPNAATVVWLRARRAYEDGDFAGAIPLLKRLLSMGERKSYDIDVAFDPTIVTDSARLNLGVCLLREAELDEAEAVLRRISPQSPRYADAMANLRTIATIRGQFA